MTVPESPFIHYLQLCVMRYVQTRIVPSLPKACKGGRLNASAKNIDSCQPAQSAQADVGRNFSLS